MNDLIAEYIRSLKLIETVYFKIEAERRDPNVIQYWAARCPGGAYYYIGRITLSQDHLTITSPTKENILERRFHSNNIEQHYINDPDLLDKIRNTLYIASKNALKWHDLEHQQAWARYGERTQAALKKIHYDTHSRIS